MWLNDKRLGAVAVVIGAIMIYAAGRLPVIPVYGDVGPAFIPRIIGYGLILTGLLLALTDVVFRRKPAAADEQKVTAAGLRDGGLFTGLTVLYLLALNWIGFIWSTIVFLILESHLFGYRRHWQMFAMGAVTTVVLYLTFKVWLRVPLPM